MRRAVGARSSAFEGEDAVSLGDEIDQAADVHGLAAAWAKLPRVVADLIAENYPAGKSRRSSRAD